MDYAAALLAVLLAPDEDAKAAVLEGLTPPPPEARWEMPELPRRPGRPAHYVEGALPRRRKTLAQPAARLALLQNLHHIELSAVDLAVVAALRGSGQPEGWHADCLRVAREEAGHARLVAGLLQARGQRPGALPVHFQLWDACRACADLGEHLAVVPRLLEGRGLDAACELLPRLAEHDPEAHAVLQRIYDDEIGHVAVGTRWHHRWCAEHGQNSATALAAAAERYLAGRLWGPGAPDREGRRQAGFTAAELDLFVPAGDGSSPAR
jgi:uncharacterized ferritin-like protein (DUF455 family)